MIFPYILRFVKGGYCGFGTILQGWYLGISGQKKEVCMFGDYGGLEFFDTFVG